MSFQPAEKVKLTEIDSTTNSWGVNKNHGNKTIKAKWNQFGISWSVSKLHFMTFAANKLDAWTHFGKRHNPTRPTHQRGYLSASGLGVQAWVTPGNDGMLTTKPKLMAGLRNIWQVVLRVFFRNSTFLSLIHWNFNRFPPFESEMVSNPIQGSESLQADANDAALCWDLNAVAHILPSTSPCKAEDGIGCDCWAAIEQTKQG